MLINAARLVVIWLMAVLIWVDWIPFWTKLTKRCCIVLLKRAQLGAWIIRSVINVLQFMLCPFTFMIDFTRFNCFILLSNPFWPFRDKNNNSALFFLTASCIFCAVNPFFTHFAIVFFTEEGNVMYFVVEPILFKTGLKL